MTILQFESVTMQATKGLVEIIKGLSFSVAAGDFVALVGPSGAGKSSLLRLINRLSEVSSGTILFEGQDIRQLPVVSLRRQIALVHQESRLLGMTVQQALGYPLTLQGAPAEEISRQVSQWAERLNIPSDWMGREAVNLSLGQRQRVAIARTLISQPKLLLLDEPTSSQDVGYSEFLLSRLAEWCGQEKLTIIMANHQIELVQRYVNRLLHLDDGRLAADIPTAEVNWHQIRQSLITAEQKAQAEWS